MLSTRKEFLPTALDTKILRWLTNIVAEISLFDPLDRAAEYYQLAHECSEKTEDGRGNTLHLQKAVCFSLLADLSDQGWLVEEIGGKIWVSPANHKIGDGETLEQVKQRVRKGLERSSNRQLAEPSVQKFLQAMEKESHHADRKVSIRTLIDDGDVLSERLAAINRLGEEARVRALSRLVRPVVQECRPNDRCEFTGLKLQDIWRYFRHTWSLQYNPLPGRTLRLLIRNAARPNNPVIGLAMLASPAANLYSRDEWIGWQIDELIDGLMKNQWPAADVSNSLVNTLREAVRDIRTDDLVKDCEIERPTEQTFFRLEQLVAKAQAGRKSDLIQAESKHLIDIRDLDKSKISNKDWHSLSSTSLYLKKRAEQLIPLLRALLYFHRADYKRAPAATLYEALVNENGRKMVQVALNEIKKRKLASEVAEVAVCGAIPPYNHLLGGKLVALLMCSKETKEIYARRYSKQPSEIASQIAGRALIRSSDLKLLTTTSLYGVGSSQYNRLKLRAVNIPNLKKDITWEELRPSEGFTITHISRMTANLMQRLSIEVYGRRRINSVFGEGSSPRTRQIRDGLNLIGINNDDFLMQSNGRRVYGCELYPGARDDLLGFVKKKNPGKVPSASTISSAWRKRWLLMRAANPEVLERLSASNSGAVIQGLADRAKDAKLEAGTEGDKDADTTQALSPLPECRTGVAQ